jgi:DNA-binding Lrp family transcriptional regulator
MSPLDDTDRRIINALQGGFPLVPEPFAAVAQDLGVTSAELIARLKQMVAQGALSRFGPLWNVEELGGAVCLCAMAVPSERFDDVAAQVNSFIEVAHNYARDHALNMWFVVSAETQAKVADTITAIARTTGLDVLPMPKETEFFIGFQVEV